MLRRGETHPMVTLAPTPSVWYCSGMEHDDIAHAALDHMDLSHERTAPMYGVISHYYLGSKYPSSMTFILQALAAIEATAPIAEDGYGFFATMGDIVEHTNLEASTVARVLNALEDAEVLTRRTRPFKPSIFWVTWENTLLGDEGAAYLHEAQNLLVNS